MRSEAIQACAPGGQEEKKQQRRTQVGPSGAYATALRACVGGTRDLVAAITASRRQ